MSASTVVPSPHWRGMVRRDNYWTFSALNPHAPYLRPRRQDSDAAPQLLVLDADANQLLFGRDAQYATAAAHEHLSTEYRRRVEAGDHAAAVEYASGDPWAFRSLWFVQYVERLAAVNPTDADAIWKAWRGSHSGPTQLRNVHALIVRDLDFYEVSGATADKAAILTAAEHVGMPAASALSEGYAIHKRYATLQAVEGIGDTAAFVLLLRAIAQRLSDALQG